MTDLAKLGLFVDSTGVVRATDHLGKFGKEGQRAEGIAGKFGKTGKAAFGAVAVAAASAVSAIASIGGAVSVIRQFETSMSQVAAITGATATELEALRDVAKDLGSTTEFSAAQAADGLRFLGMAGFNAAESMKAIPAVLDLATASSMGLAESADIASNVLSGFGLAAGEAAQVADVLAAASSRSNTSVSQLGSAMSTVAPIAAALDISLQDTAAAIGVMSDAGIQGERAGTALRGVLASLAGPTDAAADALSRYGLSVADVDPATRSLTEIFGLLQERGLSTADAMEIFGREAASGALVMVDASDRVGEFGEELRGAEGAARSMADIVRDNLGGAANTLMSTVQGLAIALGEAGLTAVLIGALNAATALVRGITSLVETAGAVIDWVTSFGTFASTLKNVQAASDTANLAIADTLAQVNALSVAEMGGRQVSLDYAGAKLEQARASYAAAEAIREERIEQIKAGEEYQRLIEKQIQLNDNVAMIQDILSESPSQAALDMMEFMRDPTDPDNLDGFVVQLERSLVKLRDTVAQQQLLTGTVGETNEEMEAALRQIELYEAAIAAAKDGTVVLGAETSDAADTTAALARLSGEVNFDTAAASAQNLAEWLGVSLSTALSLAATTPAMADEDLLMSQSVIPDSEARAAQREAVANFERMTAALNGGGRGGSGGGGLSGAAKDAEKEMEKLNSEIETLNEAADPMRKFNRELDHLNTLNETGQLTEGAYAEAFRDMNAELVESTPLLAGLNDGFGQFIDYALDGFKDGMAGIWDIFKRTLTSMIATAAKSRITFGLGIGATGAGAAAAGTPGGMMGGLGNLMGGSGFLGLGGGAGSLFGGAGLLGMGGGSSLFGLGAGSGLAGALGGGAFGAAASVALPIIGIGLAIGALFKKTEVLVAEGVRARIDGASLELDSYEKTKTNNGLGMSSGFSRDFDRLDDAVQSAVGARLDATIDALGAFGLGTDLTGFSFSKRTEIKEGETFEGESEEVIREALSAAIEFATEGALEAFQRSGEEMSDTLDRLTLSIGTVNQAMELLNMGMVNQTLENADMASALIEMSGGMEAFSSSLGSYYQAFYSEGEQMRNLLAGVQKEFAALGLKVPETRDGFRAMVESLDVTTESGAETFAMMMQLAGAMDTVYSAASNASGGMIGLAAQLRGGVSSLSSSVGNFAEATFAAEAAVGVAQETLTSALSSLSSAVFRAMDEADQRLAAAERTMETALRSLAQSITGEIRDLDAMLADAETGLSDALSGAFRAIDAEIEGLASGIDAAGEAADKARSLFEKLRDALDDRRLGTDAETRLRRSRALAELQGGIQDEDRLGKVLSTLNEPSEQLFGSFRDYALDFAKTSAAIQQQRDLAEDQMQAADTELEAAQQQVELLEAQKDTLQQQYNTLLGLNTSTLSVASAVRQFQDASATYQDVQSFHIAEVARLEAIRDQFGIVADASLSVENAITAYTEAAATYADEQAWHTERMGYLQSLVDRYDLQIEGIDAVEAALQGVIEATNGVQTAVEGVQQAINNLATALIGALQGVGGTAMLEGMGAEAFSVFSDDRTNAILSDAAADLLTGTAAALNDAFNATLGRNIGAGGLAYYGEQLEGGRAIEQIMRELLLSQEAQTGKVPGFTGTGTGFTADNIPDRAPTTPLSEVEAIFTTMLGRMPSGDYWENSGLTGGALVDAIRSGAIANGEVPAYARGGMHAGGLAIVGEEGPELVNMGPSRVWNASQTRDMLSNRELVEEIRALRSEVARLAAYNRQTTINTGDTARRIKDFDRNGLPKERV